jgi:PAS domain S-box-containing protein
VGVRIVAWASRSVTAVCSHSRLMKAIATRTIMIIDETTGIAADAGLRQIDVRVRVMNEQDSETGQTKADLLEQLAAFQLLAEKSVMGIFIIQNSTVAYANPSFARMFGYEIDEMVGKLTPRDLIHPDDMANVTRRFWDNPREQIEPANVSYKAVKRDGSIFYIEFYGSVIEYQGRPAVMGALID